MFIIINNGVVIICVQESKLKSLKTLRKIFIAHNFKTLHFQCLMEKDFEEY